MNWPERRPDYLPEAVWEAAKTPDLLPCEFIFAAAQPDRHRVKTLVSLLIGPDMAPTWRGLAKRGVADPDSWQALLSCFVTCAPGIWFDKGARDALDKAAALAKEIAKMSSELERKLEDLRRIAGPHGLVTRLSFLGVGAYQPRSSPQGQPWRDRVFEPVDILDLLRRLTAAAEGPPPERAYPGGYTATRKSGLIAAWVRHFDESFALYYERQIIPRGLTLTDSELARVGAAVLGFPVSREAVKYSRANHPAEG